MEQRIQKVVASLRFHEPAHEEPALKRYAEPDAGIGVRLRSESNCGEYIVQRFCVELATDVSKVTQLS